MVVVTPASTPAPAAADTVIASEPWFEAALGCPCAPARYERQLLPAVRYAGYGRGGGRLGRTRVGEVGKDQRIRRCPDGIRRLGG